MIILLFVFLVLAYLIGSLNSAIIISHLLKLPDPRAGGSGNPGATNVMRVSGNKQAALLVFLVDALKGFLPVLIASWFGFHGFSLALIGLAVVAGHIFPIFYNFKGGKGVAPTFGVLLALSFFIFFIILVLWLIITAFTRYVSLASLISVIVAPFLAVFIGYAGYFLPLVFIALLVIYRHLDNIQRLREGTENKISF